MTNQDIRWIQRFNHFMNAFKRLEDAVTLYNDRTLSDLEEQGLIQAFEYTHELAWNVFKDFLEDRGVTNLYGSKDTTRYAFKNGLIDNGEVWMDMIISRNLTSHTYDEELAKEIIKKIVNVYIKEFDKMFLKFNTLKNEN
ncbi:MAG TPA: nucleotidyltransferase substrate binding protein [Spirochaetota bacterium]|nr:nucleotidyltransferase substrate binding protein [Spirochaetota bacterium]HOM09115.1 nucleotidyltransferase substrate binding protein [Spirochaetota bacterium]HPP48936.1 nucleotidyltransferase substrate binding protein [Spirochaetota bacterium]